MFFTRPTNIINSLLLLTITNSLHADTINPEYKYYQTWAKSTDENYKTFWSYTGSSLSNHDINTFNIWHSKSKFKNISPKIGEAYFLKSPWSHQIKADDEGNLVFVRNSDEKEPHTMVELSMNNQPKTGNFVNYDGFRSMATGIPYEIFIDVKVINNNWVKNVPWLVVFQGHAIPDKYDEGKKFNPPFALIISRGRWQVHVRADSRLSLPDDRKYERFDKIDLGEVIFDKWTTFKIKVIWGSKSLSKKNPAALELWRDNTLLFQEWGRHNFYNNITPSGDNLGPYLMIGAYTPKFDTQYDPITIKIKEFTIKIGTFK